MYAMRLRLAELFALGCKGMARWVPREYIDDDILG